MQDASERTPLTGKAAIGQHVISADGVDLGTVKDMTSKEFQVAANRGSDYWLDRQSIAGIDGDQLRMAFEAEQVSSHKVPNNMIDRSEPATAPATSAAPSDEPSQSVLGHEQDRAREQMERELAVQRQRMQASRAQPEAPPDTGRTVGEPVESEMARREGVPVADVVHEARHEAQSQGEVALRDVNDLRGMHVMATREGRDVGTVRDVLFDPDERAVLGIMVDSAADDGSRMFLPREQIRGFGERAVTVESEEDLAGIASAPRQREMIDHGVHLEGVKVITESGDALGKLDRVLLDDRGAIAGCHAKSGLFGLGHQRDIAPADIVSIGPDAVVVRDHAA